MVKRYSVILDRITGCECGIRGDSKGNYVLFADYETLERGRDALREALKGLRSVISETRGECAREAVQIADELLAKEST